MKVRLVVDRWDEPVDGGYERHVKGDVVDVAHEVGEWLVASGSGSAAVEPKPAPADDAVKPAASKRSRRKAAGN